MPRKKKGLVPSGAQEENERYDEAPPMEKILVFCAR